MPAGDAGRLIDELDRLGDRGLARHRVGLALIPPGEPWRNGCIESFNGRLRTNV